MNIQDAIKSGRPFKRPKQIRDWPSLWLKVVNSTVCIDGEEKHIPANLTTIDLCAEDWELKGETWPDNEFYLAPSHYLGAQCINAHILNLKSPNLNNFKGLIKVRIVEENNV